MKNNQAAKALPARLPQRLRPFFWEYNFSKLRWKTDADLIIGRVLAVGDLQSIQWLLRVLTDAKLREWLERRRGAGLSAKQLRFWELILGLPRRQVSEWLKDPGRQSWERRCHA